MGGDGRRWEEVRGDEVGGSERRWKEVGRGVYNNNLHSIDR